MAVLNGGFIITEDGADGEREEEKRVIAYQGCAQLLLMDDQVSMKIEHSEREASRKASAMVVDNIIVVERKLEENRRNEVL